jgi:hypothetical protein
MKSRSPKDPKALPKKPSSTGKQQEAASGAGSQYGEGNYAATRQYNKGVKDHMDHHDVEREAREAEPRTASEEKDMEDAEREGRSRSKGGDSLNGPDGAQ